MTQEAGIEKYIKILREIFIGVHKMMLCGPDDRG